MQLIALEGKAQIRSAVALWKQSFSTNAMRMDAMSGEVFWHERLGVWGFFSDPYPPTSHHYWNPFGRVPSRPRQNMIVEVNPPAAGINMSVQGVIAKDGKGNRWVLHRGRLHPKGIRITEEMFDAVTTSKRMPVRFSDNSVENFHVVTNIYSSPSEIQQQIANFVFERHRSRLYYSGGERAAKQELNVVSAETLSLPELQGSYSVGPQDQKTVQRRHADVWHSLTNFLDKSFIKHSNARVGRHGPDLRTFGQQPVLFEIKSDSISGAIQQGVGQLLLYEILLGVSHRKVLVLPTEPSKELAKAIGNLNIEWLTYSRKGRSITFDTVALLSIVRPAS